jgi:uncharacterized membrane protein
MTLTPAPKPIATVARWLLAGALLFAGVGHFINADTFLAQVPPWMPFPAAVVAVSGVVEIALGISLLALRSRRTQVGWIVAAFFVLIFPGNISQLLTQTDAFGLDSDVSRAVRLLFQPLLVVWALWSTGAWQSWWSRRKAERRVSP